MKIIKPSVTIIAQEPGYDGMMRHIELCGRTCYKSTDRITENSAERFVDTLKKSGHLSVLEHGAVYLQMPYSKVAHDAFDRNPYSKVSAIEEAGSLFVSTNYRVIIEHHLEDLMKYQVEPGPMHELRVTARFATQIAITREYNRHRVNSPSEESTRYVNYSKERFGNKIAINLPTWIDENEIRVYPDDTESFQSRVQRRDWSNLNGWHELDYWLFANEACEFAYMNLIRLGWKPQQARTILPLDTNTELVHTAFVNDWKHFFGLRCAHDAHPDARFLATELKNLMTASGIIEPANEEA